MASPHAPSDRRENAIGRGLDVNRHGDGKEGARRGRVSRQLRSDLRPRVSVRLLDWMVPKAVEASKRAGLWTKGGLKIRDIRGMGEGRNNQ
jgi:hypothetical protein